MTFSIGKILMIAGFALVLYNFIVPPFNIYIDVVAFFLVIAGVMTFKKDLKKRKD